MNVQATSRRVTSLRRRRHHHTANPFRSLEFLEDRVVMTTNDTALSVCLALPWESAQPSVEVGASMETQEHLAGGGGAEWKEVSGTLPAGSSHWTATEGPYHVTGDLTVPADGLLRIDAGTSIYVDAGLEIVVRGTLVAQGFPDQPIVFTAPPNAPAVPDRPHGNPGLPDGPPRWLGLHFRGSRSSDNLLSYVDVQYGQSDDGSIGVIDSNAVIDHAKISGTHLRMVYANNASLVVQNSTFPDMFGPDEHPVTLGLDNVSEQIKIVGKAPAGGQLIVRGNHFGTNKGHNDVIDGDSGLRPEPILQILDNVFTGTGDELLDLGGDVFVAGNLFRHVAKDPDNQDARFSNAISTGDGGASSTVVMVRNVFYDVDHAMHLRGGNAAMFENNTIVNVHPPGKGLGSALALYANVGGERPGRGAYFADNIFANVPTLFGNVDQPAGQTTALKFEHNLISAELAQQPIGNRGITALDLGTNNVIGSPQFIDEALADFQLDATSPVRGAGLWGNDLGAFVSSDIQLLGSPVGATTATTATMSVGGPGLFSYRYRIDGADWSDERPIGNGFAGVDTVRVATLELTQLTPGAHQLEVVGRDFAGNWQAIPTTHDWYVTERIGDLNHDGIVGADDITQLCAAITSAATSPEFDLNGDGQVNVGDTRTLVRSILQIPFGDSSLDGLFNSTDLVVVFQAGEYEDEPVGNSTWSEGDWDCDGDFTTADLVFVFQEGSYSAAARW